MCPCSGSYTFLDLQLNHFWNAMVEFLPLWMAPNLVTLTGTIIVVFTTALLLVISPKLEGGAPGWAYVLSGVGLFVYQTLDAIDGKQARRTGSSRCDALSAMLNCLTAFVAFRAGNSTYTFAGLSSVSVNFFFAQCRILVPLAMFLAVVYAPDLVDVAIATPLVASLVYAAIVTAVYVHYILSAVFEICAHLKIDLLTLPAKKSE
ncbi:hypothetical protein DYB32_003517 [Aphanomyces invadans]|uniref:CDP-alcohol phosphatidyltransferase n=1 Tax=Aphanomyces invadans TaxID=157072 RepID=A0A418B0K9_9STRA|nr:hypothetical protein DYB32_003517 [Aphanomyces invadans]